MKKVAAFAAYLYEATPEGRTFASPSTLAENFFKNQKTVQYSEKFFHFWKFVHYTEQFVLFITGKLCVCHNGDRRYHVTRLAVCLPHPIWKGRSYDEIRFSRLSATLAALHDRS